jgi:hypothetical protein
MLQTAVKSQAIAQAVARSNQLNQQRAEIAQIVVNSKAKLSLLSAADQKLVQEVAKLQSPGIFQRRRARAWQAAVARRQTENVELLAFLSDRLRRVVPPSGLPYPGAATPLPPAPVLPPSASQVPHPTFPLCLSKADHCEFWGPGSSSVHHDYSTYCDLSTMSFGMSYLVKGEGIFDGQKQPATHTGSLYYVVDAPGDGQLSVVATITLTGWIQTYTTASLPTASGDAKMGLGLSVIQGSNLLWSNLVDVGSAHTGPAPDVVHFVFEQHQLTEWVYVSGNAPLVIAVTVYFDTRAYSDYGYAGVNFVPIDQNSPFGIKVEGLCLNLFPPPAIY